MRRLAGFVFTRRWWVLGVTLVFLIIAAVFGGGVSDRLSLGGFADPNSDSTRAIEAIADEFDGGQPGFVLVATAESGDVDDPDTIAAGEAVTADLADQPGVTATVSYWSAGRAAPLRSVDGDQALILATLVDEEPEVLVDVAGELSEKYTGTTDGLKLEATGSAEVGRQLSEQAEEDLSKAELLSAPATLLALILVFGAVAAGLLPLVVGAVAVVGTYLALTLLTEVTDVSIFALNLTTALGLGLGIDYSLFIVSRYREELAKGLERRVALSRTMQTAGRTVAFSAATVIVSLSALIVFPVLYLRSFAYAGVVVIALAATCAIIVLPAILAVLGDRVDKGRLFAIQPPKADGIWARQTRRVMARPWIYIIVVTTFLVILAAPFFHLETGLRDDRLVSDKISSRAATDQIRENFESRESDAVVVYLPGGANDPEGLDAYASRVATLEGVARVDTVGGFYLADAMVPPTELSQRFDNGTSDTWISVVPTVEPISPEAEDLVAELRDLPAPGEGALVGGPSAELVDSKAAVLSRLPLALAIIVGVTFILLFAMTGSLLVPLKALLLNALSLTAAFGALVWIFQDGHLSGVLDFEATGFIDVFTPILLFCIAFGLSMDYEVFLLSRIKEDYDLSRDNDAAVASGLQHTGRIVTAAALLLSIVFAGLATAEVAIVKMFGVGLAIAVLVDAFLIRATLVPAFMKLAGRANWWAPKPLRRLHLRFGIWENDPIAVLDKLDEDAD